MNIMNKMKKAGSVQTVLLILIVLIVGGLVGGALVYLAVSQTKSPIPINTRIIYPPGTNLPTFAPVIEVIKPAVVNIYTQQTFRSPRRYNPFEGTPFEDLLGDEIHRFFFNQPPRDYTMQSLGSGVCVDPEGYILTNNHVVERADKIRVKMADGKEFEAELIGKDSKTDLALIKITNRQKFPYAQLGDSDQIKVGDWVLAIGNPYNYSGSVSHGIISALGRQVGVAEYEDFIQTDAAINQGNSGGPLVNLKGEVIGINTVIATRTGDNIGIGFAIPSNLAMQVYTELRKQGKVIRGWLGIGLEELTEYHQKKFGVDSGIRVTGVVPSSPADKAGIKTDDIIIEYDGKLIKTPDQLRRVVSMTEVGKTITIKIVRDKKPISVKVLIGEMPADTSDLKFDTQDITLGLSVSNVTPDIARRLKLDKVIGVIVSDIERGSVAGQAGIEKNDIILEFNDKIIRNIDDFKSAVKGLNKGDKINLRIYRQGYIIYITFEAEG